MSQVCLLYLFQRTRAELLKTESSSTIRGPPPKLLPQPLTPDAKLHRLRAAAAISCERRAWALASSPIVSSTSQVCLLYLFQRTRAKLLKTESSSTIRSLPPKLLPQPLTPNAKWRRLWAAAAMSCERRAQALASSPVVSSTSPGSAVHKSPPFDSSPSMHQLKNHPRHRIMRQ